MPFDEAQKEIISEWLMKNGVALACPSCMKVCPQEVSEMIATPVFVEGGISFITTVPMIPVICSRCAHIRFFSAVMMGLVPRTMPEQTTKDPAPTSTGEQKA